MNELTNLVTDIFGTQITVSKAALKAEKALEDYHDSIVDTKVYPKCDLCDETITDEYYEIEDMIICPNCMASSRKEIEE